MPARAAYCEWPPLKRIYYSEASAKAAADQNSQRHYECPHCGYWHLSTKSGRTKRGHRKRVQH